MRNRIIFGVLLNLPLILSPNLVQAVSHLVQAVSPEMLKASLAASIWETNDMPPLLSRRYNRFEPGTIPDRLMEQAHHYLKTPYRRGGSLQTGQSTDCSGFVQYLYQKADIRLPRASAAQAQVGKVAARSMDFSRLRTGDLLFFRDGGRHIGHVGIYLGEGKMIHASSHKRGVAVADLYQPYYRGNFVVAKRLIEAPRTSQASPAQIPARPVIN